MITIKTPEEIKILREGGKILASVLLMIKEYVTPGVSTIELDEYAEKLMRRAGGEPSFKNYKTKDDKIPFPASLCVSVNDEVVHGIPSQDKILKDGDIVSLDLGMKYKNLYTDATISVLCKGPSFADSQKLLDVARTGLAHGIAAVREDNHIGDISFAIQSYVEANGFNVVKSLVGHGVGHSLHEDPEIPNFGKKGEGVALKEGMVLAIEPMITTGSGEVYLDKNKWTWKTKDGSLAAHFEHTVAVTSNGCDVLTKI